MSPIERRRRLTRGVAALLVVWAAGALAHAAFERWRQPLWNSPQAAQWHLEPASPRVRRLARFLRAVDKALGPGARVTVEMPVSGGDPADAMFRYLWVAYLLPRQEVLPPWYDGVHAPGEHWASFHGAGTPPAGAIEIGRWENGALYRLAPPPAAPPTPP